jgi:tetratricopeptide (TPR) repeat protein
VKPPNHGILLATTLFFWIGSVNLFGSQERFELRGRIVDSEGEAIRHVVPQVILYGSTFPFETKTLVNRGGEFKIKKLEAGAYRLLVVVPSGGSMEKTIEIGPSFADKKGRIERQWVFEPSYDLSHQSTVSPDQLTISSNAVKEYKKALKLLEKKDVEGAVEHLERAIEISPNYSVALNRLGTISFQSRNYSRAEGYFERALSGDPSAYAPLVNLCAAQFALKKLEKSLECNRKAIAIDPDDPLARSQLGHSFFALGKYDSAEVELIAAKELDPVHFSYPQLILAEIYRIREDLPSMIREIQEFLKYHPDVPFAPKLRKVLERKRAQLDDKVAQTPD